jgi:hypothetical protein
MNKMIDEAYENYLIEDAKILPNMSKEKMLEFGFRLTKEEFLNKIKTDDEFAKKWGVKGVVYVPYIFKTTKTTINNETVWHSNYFINFFLKLKRFVFPSKNLKRWELYSSKPINTKFYSRIEIKNNINENE